MSGFGEVKGTKGATALKAVSTFTVSVRTLGDGETMVNWHPQSSRPHSLESALDSGAGACPLQQPFPPELPHVCLQS